MTVKYYTDEATGRPKIVTKDGKVSCSCCELCCMYPSQALADGDYTADDLPDSVLLTYDLVEGFELTRSGSEFIGVFDQSLTYRLSIGIPPEASDHEWLLYINDGLDDNNACLIQGDGNLNPGDDIVEDQFADTYTVNGPTGGTVTRESACVWSGAGLRLTNFGYQWKVNGNNKSGLQNTPVGSYAGGFTVS